jgi:DNA integrity scanning protein DisA with diadenylate cyclase activity
MGDAVGDSGRDRVDESFDAALAPLTVASLPRSVLADLASLDGAVVLANTGRILSYGSVLEPKKRRGILKAEGSRTKAAIGSSNYGLALKISSDGDITVYVGGAELIRV